MFLLQEQERFHKFISRQPEELQLLKCKTVVLQIPEQDTDVGFYCTRFFSEARFTVHLPRCGLVFCLGAFLWQKVMVPGRATYCDVVCQVFRGA